METVCEPSGKTIKPVKRVVQDASFSAWIIWHYFLGAISSNQLTARENHAARSGMMLMTEVTAGVSSGSAR